MIFQETLIGVAAEVDAHANDGDAFGAELFLEIDERGHFFDAGSAPGSPEIQDQNLALEVVEVNFAVGVLHGEFGRGGVDARRPGAVVTTCEEDEQ